jgi:hypothetical protein
MYLYFFVENVKRINTFCEKDVELGMLDLAVRIVTTAR